MKQLEWLARWEGKVPYGEAHEGVTPPPNLHSCR